MKKIVATLDVIVTDGPSKYEPAHPYITGGVHRIYVNPDDARKIRAMGAVNLSQEEIVSNILAHELGHFVAEITGRQKSYAKGATPAEIKTTEETAWELAGKIHDVSPKVQEIALRSYQNPRPIPPMAPRFFHDNKVSWR